MTARGDAHEGPRFDTVVVAGGRSSRLGGTPKALLPVAGSTLLARTVDAALPFGTVVVVGPEDLPLPLYVLRVREDPPFSGPAAAVAAGVVTLAATPERLPWTAVLACDMPDVHRALAQLRATADRAASDVAGLIAVTGEGRRENLVVLARTDALSRALAAAPTENASLRSVWRRLGPQEVTVPAGATGEGLPTTRRLTAGRALDPLGRTRVIPAYIQDGRVIPEPTVGPAMLSGLAHADVLLVVPEDGMQPGQDMEAIPLPWRL